MEAFYQLEMKTEDQQLSNLLKQWPDIEPPSDFRAKVWQKIRAEEAHKSQSMSLGELLHRWLQAQLLQPVFSVVTAVVIGLVAGLWGGTISAPRPPITADTGFGFLSSRTLAGSYLHLASGQQQ